MSLKLTFILITFFESKELRFLIALNIKLQSEGLEAAKPFGRLK